jgi:hypothetical protein
MKDATQHVLARGLGVTRTAMGVLALARPHVVSRSPGRKHPSSPDSEALARMFGIRDLALAVLTLSVSPRTRRAALRLGVLADSADAVFIAIAARRATPDIGAALSAGFATLSAALGLVTLYQPHRVGSRCRTTTEDIS